MGLSDAFDTFDHSLLVAKLEAYRFDSLSVEFMKNYLINRKQRYKVGNCQLHQVSRKGPPQGSIPWTLAF